MHIELRQGGPQDADTLGVICYEAFRLIAEAHSFPPDFPAPEAAIGLMDMLLARPDVYSVVAEVDGKVAGSNFLWEGEGVSGVGPITVDPAVQNSAIGRGLMIDVIRRSDDRGFFSVRLVQAAYHNRSLALYTKLGLNTVEPLSIMNGPRIGVEIPGLAVREMQSSDIDEANALCMNVHGHGRRGEIADAVAHRSGQVVTNGGRIVAYSTVLGFFGHSVAESNDGLKAIIGGAEAFAGVGFLIPMRNSELMRWCLGNGLKIVQPMTLMARGTYQEPRGAYLPSILY
jgi:predicted N-acetyltransferase YhbS